MAKASATKPAARGAKPLTGRPHKGDAGRAKVVQRDLETGQASTGQASTGQASVSKARFEAVMQAAEQSGLLDEKTGRIGGRVSPALVEQAKRQTGIETDTDLIEFALASVALDDNFAEAFKGARGKIEPTVKLGF